MAQPIKWPGANKELAPAKGTAAFVQPMHVFSNGKACVSCWELSADDVRDLIEQMDKGKAPRIFVSIFYGASQPPVFVGNEDDTRMVVSDFGSVWKK